MWVAAQVKRRIERETTRPDFMTLILANNRDKGSKLSQAEIDSNSFFLMNAGSETTATALSGVSYHLLSNPAVLRKLQDEGYEIDRYRFRLLRRKNGLILRATGNFRPAEDQQAKAKSNHPATQASQLQAST